MHSRKYEGFVNAKAIGVVATEKGVQVLSKKSDSLNKPAKAQISVSYNANKSGRK